MGKGTTILEMSKGLFKILLVSHLNTITNNTQRTAIQSSKNFVFPVFLVLSRRKSVYLRQF